MMKARQVWGSTERHYQLHSISDEEIRAVNAQEDIQDARTLEPCTLQTKMQVVIQRQLEQHKEWMHNQRSD